MAGIERREKPSIVSQLAEEGYRFDFYQAVRLLTLLRPQSTELAEGADPSAEAVRLRSVISFAFPPADVLELRDGELPELLVHFMSLAGGHGPLPHPVSELVLERVNAKDTALRDFLDMFHHRLLSLCYRIHRVHRIGVDTGSPETHSFASYLYSLIGLGTGGLRDRMAIPDRALLRYSGLLHKTPRDAAGLETMLSDFFAVPVRCEQMCGAFRALDASQCTQLGDSGQNCQLGIDTMLGESVWDQSAGVKLTLGPLSFAQYQDFLPERPGCVALCAVARFYLGQGVDLTVTALVQALQRPRLALSGQAEKGARLGWTTWLLGGLAGLAKDVVESELFALPQFMDAPATSSATL